MTLKVADNHYGRLS